MSTGPAILQPTFTGHVASTHDALVLFEACLTGQLSHVPRRPHDRERNALIRSGCIFIYEENASGIKRWTDGVTWSPSRILGNFLVYRELDKPFPPGEKKRAMKKNNRRPSRPGEPYAPSDPHGPAYSPTPPSTTPLFSNERAPTEVERQLIGSLIDSYGFKADGLVKKTMSVTVQGVTHHLVSYYNVDDVVAGHLHTPMQTENLQYIRPRPELISKQSFRSPIEELDDTIEREHAPGPYGYRPLGPQAYHPSAHPYYVPGPYPPATHHPGTSGAYSVGIPAIAGNYLSTPVATPQLPARTEEYAPFTPAAYHRGYDGGLTHQAPAASQPRGGPPPPPSGVPGHLPDRPPPPPHHPAMYPQPPLQPRPATHASPASAESRHPDPYHRGSFSLPHGHPSPVDHRRAVQSSPVPVHDRRDSTHGPAPVYAHERPPYYVSHPHAPISPAHYPPGPPLSSWANAASHQPSLGP